MAVFFIAGKFNFVKKALQIFFFHYATIQMSSNNILTPKQTRIYQYIQKCRRESNTAPTYREIAEEFGFKSPKAAEDHVSALEKKGYVRRRCGRSRGIELLIHEIPNSNTVTIPILGNIQAGPPQYQVENLSGTLAIDEAIIGKVKGHRLFALRVNGDSMDGRSIHDGDWVVADVDAMPHEGDVVVALIDGQNTLKTLIKRKGGYLLKAENAKYSDLIPSKEMRIQGVVKVLYRRVS